MPDDTEETSRRGSMLAARFKEAGAKATAEGDADSAVVLNDLADLMNALASGESEELLKKRFGNRIAGRVAFARIVIADMDDKDHDPATCVECRGRMQMMMANPQSRVGEA